MNSTILLFGIFTIMVCGLSVMTQGASSVSGELNEEESDHITLIQKIKRLFKDYIVVQGKKIVNKTVEVTENLYEKIKTKLKSGAAKIEEMID